MAKTPSKKRRRSSSAPVIISGAWPTPPKAKSTKPPKVTQRSWHIHHARLLRPLTPTQQGDIREVLPLRQAAQLLRDWPRISAVAHHHALVKHMGATNAKLLLSLEVRNRRDAQLRKAMKGVDTAISGIEAMVDNWSRHIDLRDSTALSAWAAALTSQLIQRRGFIEQSRTRAAAWPKASVTRGQPTQPMTYLRHVLLSYFRAHD